MTLGSSAQSPKKRRGRKRSADDEPTELITPLKYPDDTVEPFPSGVDDPGNSSDEEDANGSREQRVWKQAVIQVWKQVSEHKNALIFKERVTNDTAHGYEETVKRPMDLGTIKKNIESGILLTTRDFEHAVMQMYANALMYNTEGTIIHDYTIDMRRDSKQRFIDFRNIMSSASRAEKTSEDTGRKPTRGGAAKTEAKPTRGGRRK
jgi:hypothetical protein